MEKEMSIHEKLSVACGYLEDVGKDVVAFVKKHNGFIDTQNFEGECDNIYAYVINWATDEVEEKGVYAIRVNDADKLELAVFDKYMRFNTLLDEKDFEDAEWHICDMSGDSVFFSQTIISIAESIEQYV